MSYRCEHSKDCDICVLCWEEKNLDNGMTMSNDMTTPPQPPTSETPTPRTDAYYFKIRNNIHGLATLVCNGPDIDFARQLEKELHEAKEDSQVLNNYHNNPAWLKHYIKGRDYSFPEFVDNLIIERDNLTTELALFKARCGEMREVLNDIPKCHVPNPPMDVRIDSAAWCHWMDERNQVLSSTPTTQPATQTSSCIPMDVAEKMYEALYRETMCKSAISESTSEAFQLAQQYRLGKKDKANDNTTA